MAWGAQDRARWSCGAQGGAVSLKVGRGQRVFRAQEVQPRQCLPDTARPAGLGSGGTEPGAPARPGGGRSGGGTGARAHAERVGRTAAFFTSCPPPRAAGSSRHWRSSGSPLSQDDSSDLGLAPRSCEDSPTPKQVVRPWSEALDGPGATAPSARPRAAVFP